MKYRITQEYDANLQKDVWFALNPNGGCVIASVVSAEDCEKRLRESFSRFSEKKVIKEIEL